MPTALKLMHGNPGRRPLNMDEPKPDPMVPDPPSIFGDEALAEWERITPILYRLGLLSDIDRAALVGYCTNWGRWMEAEAELLKYGTVVKSPNGFPVQSPFLPIANRCQKQMHEFLVEFGMSPSSRSRVVANNTTDANPFKKHGRGA